MKGTKPKMQNSTRRGPEVKKKMATITGKPPAKAKSQSGGKKCR